MSRLLEMKNNNKSLDREINNHLTRYARPRTFHETIREILEGDHISLNFTIEINGKIEKHSIDINSQVLSALKTRMSQ